MENYTWAFLDENYTIIHIALGNITTMEFNPPIFDSYHIMVKCVDERGIAEIGKKWNNQTDKFE